MSAFDDYVKQMSKSSDVFDKVAPKFFAASRKGQWSDMLSNLSADNPYISQLLSVSNPSDAMDLLNAAIEYDADQASQIQTAKLNRILQQEKQAYDSPAAQLARERAAGLNPDLQGSAGSGSGSGSGAGMVQAQQFDSELDSFQRGTEVANTVFQGISAVGSFFGGVTGAISTAADFAFKVSDWANAKKRSDASTVSAQMAAAKDRFSIVDTIAKSIPPTFDEKGKQIPIQASQITDAAQQLGLLDVGGLSDFAESYVKNPSVTSFYNKMKQQEKESYADLVGTQTDVLIETVRFNRAAQLFTAQADSALANIKADVSSTLADDENYKGDQVRSQKFHASADAFQGARDYLVAKRDFESFVYQLKAIDNWVQRVNGQISALKMSGHQNEDSNRLHLNSLMATKVNLVTLAGSKIDEFYDIIYDRISKDSIWDSTHTTSGMLNPLSLLQENPTLQFVNMYNGSNMTEQISAFDTLFDALDSIPGIGSLFKSKGPRSTITTKTKTGNITTTVTKQNP